MNNTYNQTIEGLKMNIYERFALNQWLCDFPEHMTYIEVLDALLAESDDVVVWEVLEAYPAETVMDIIDSTRLSLMLDFKPKG